MASKEATIYIVDVGASMGKKHNGREVTDLDWALEYAWDKITSTVATERKTAHVGVVGLKTDGTDNDMGGDPSYDHISVLKGLGQMLMPELRDLRNQLKPSNNNVGDAISALVLAIGMIEAHCKKLKYIRQIYLITNGLSPADADEMEPIIDKIKTDDIKITVLGVDFDDAEYGFKEEDKPAEKAEVEKTLRSFVDDCGGTFATLAEAIDELGEPRVKTFKAMPSYKGYLTLGDPEKYDSAISIDVERYPKVMVAKPPSASSFVIRGDMTKEAENDDGHLDGLAAVKRASAYQVPDESAPGGKKDVDQEELAKGYAYGSTAVYISESDRTVTTFETKPGMDIIGFVEKQRYQHYMDMTRSNVIVAQRTNDKAGMALSSFIHALHELDSLAIARFVPKPDKPPVILLLCPSITPDLECLYDVELPFAEDVRQHRFPPLDRIVTVSGKTITSHRNLPTSDLQNAMSAYVDSMDLTSSTVVPPDETEYAPIDRAFTPILHRVNQVIRHRAIYPSTPLPPIPAALTRFAHPPSELLEKATPKLEELQRVAEVKRVPPKALSKRGRAGRREAPKPMSGLDVNAILSESNGNGTPGSAGLPVRRKKIDPRNAVPEFKQAIEVAEEKGDISGVEDAFTQMGTVIKGLVEKSVGSANYGRMLECIGVLREECLGLEMPEKFNDWAVGFKKDLLEGKLGGERKEAWFEVRKTRVKLISEKESGGGGAGEEEVAKWSRPGLG